MSCVILKLFLLLFPISVFPGSGFLFIMRGLFKASLLLAPALATAFVVPGAVEDGEAVDLDQVIAGN